MSEEFITPGNMNLDQFIDFANIILLSICPRIWIGFGVQATFSLVLMHTMVSIEYFYERWSRIVAGIIETMVL